MYNYKIVFSYIGTHFNGSQKQPGQTTVESSLFNKLKHFYIDLKKLNLASRTDKGVHANFQVANFFSRINIQSKSVIDSINR